MILSGHLREIMISHHKKPIINQQKIIPPPSSIKEYPARTHSPTPPNVCCNSSRFERVKTKSPRVMVCRFSKISFVDPIATPSLCHNYYPLVLFKKSNEKTKTKKQTKNSLDPSPHAKVHDSSTSNSSKIP